MIGFYFIARINARGQRTKEDEMVGCHHWLTGNEFEQTQRDGKGQGHLGCCSPRSPRESDTTSQLNNKAVIWKLISRYNLELDLAVNLPSLMPTGSMLWGKWASLETSVLLLALLLLCPPPPAAPCLAPPGSHGEEDAKRAERCCLVCGTWIP